MKTVEVTKRMATAQDLLHEALSLRTQVKNFLGFAYGLGAVEDVLRAVIVEEIEKQTSKITPTCKDPNCGCMSVPCNG